MTTFLGGPLVKFSLLLRRSPDYLRACADGDRRDALDLVGDEPAPGETLYAYRRVGRPGDVHLRMQKGSGFYKLAEYEYVTEQPGQDVMRDRGQWQAWCWGRKLIDSAGGRTDRESET